jgi:hypothetical protein
MCSQNERHEEKNGEENVENGKEENGVSWRWNEKGSKKVEEER